MSFKTVHRLFWDFEKEQRWINEHAARGEHLVRHTWGTYVFEQGKPGEWTYRMELLGASPRKPETRSYLEFLAESGIETVAVSEQWAYHRKRAADGPFELYSDLDSRLAHYKRVLALYVSLTAALLPLSVVTIDNLLDAGRALWFVLPLSAVYFIIAGLFAAQTLRVGKSIRTLEAQREVFE